MEGFRFTGLRGVEAEGDYFTVRMVGQDGKPYRWSADRELMALLVAAVFEVAETMPDVDPSRPFTNPGLSVQAITGSGNQPGLEITVTGTSLKFVLLMDRASLDKAKQGLARTQALLDARERGRAE